LAKITKEFYGSANMRHAVGELYANIGVNK